MNLPGADPAGSHLSCGKEFTTLPALALIWRDGSYLELLLKSQVPEAHPPPPIPILLWMWTPFGQHSLNNAAVQKRQLKKKCKCCIAECVGVTMRYFKMMFAC